MTSGKRRLQTEATSQRWFTKQGVLKTLTKTFESLRKSLFLIKNEFTHALP